MTPDTDLASRWLGGSVIAASDESFGEKENLLNPAPAAFEPGHYGPRGEIVDGWETRRRRSPGHDWAVIRLGAPGIITSVDVDTSFFTGNYPQAVSLEACGCEGYPSPDELGGWEQIVPLSPLAGDGHNVFPVTDGRRFTHVRLAAHPDGGVATAHFRYNASAEVALDGCERGPAGSPARVPLLARTRLQPDTRHELASQTDQPVAAVRLDAFPDGGLSRVRLIGSIDPGARRDAGYRWFNALPAVQAVQCLLGAGMAPDLAAHLAARRPLADGWLTRPDDRTVALTAMLEGRP